MAGLLLCLAASGVAWAQPPAPAVAGPVNLSSTTCTGTGCTTINTSGYGSIGVQITGTWSGTAAFRGSIDRADYSAPVNCTAKNSTSPITSTTANGLWTCDVTGLSSFRVLMTAMASGTAVVSMQLSSPSTAAGQAPAGSGGTSSAFGSALPSNGTAAGFNKASDGSMQAGQLDDNLYIEVNCKTGCSGASDTTGSNGALGALNAADTVALSAQQGVSFHLASGTLAATLTPELSFDGGATYPVPTQFVDGNLAGSATLVLTNPNAAQDYSILLLGGATHARVRVSAYTSGTATGHLTATTTLLPIVKITGTATVSGTVTANAGSGNFTVVQGTGTNLHAVIDSGSTTTVTQGTGTNLHTVIDSGTTTVTQGTGTNLHTVVDSGTVTANAGTNLNTSALALDATVTGRLPAGGSPADAESNTNTNLSRIGGWNFCFNGTSWDRCRSGDANNVSAITGFMNSAPVGRYDSTQPTLTSGRWNLFQLSSRGALMVATGADTFHVTVDGVPSNQSVNQAQVGGTAVVANPCSTAIPTPFTTSFASTTVQKLITKASSKKNYICTLYVQIGSTAETWSLLEGTKTTNECDTSTAAISGSTTAANGNASAANGGVFVVSGSMPVIIGSGTNVDVCIATSGSNRVTVTGSFVQQ